MILDRELCLPSFILAASQIMFPDGHGQRMTSNSTEFGAGDFARLQTSLHPPVPLILN